MNSLKWCRVFVLLLLLVTAGCAGPRAFQAGQDLILQERYDEAVARYFEAVEKNPDRQEYRMGLHNARNMAALDHLRKGRRFLDKGSHAEAVIEFNQAVALDPTVEAGRQELKRAREALRVEELLGQAEQFYRDRKFNQARQALDQALLIKPGHPQALELMEKVKKGRSTMVDGQELELSSDQAITLKFKQADLKDAFNVVSRLSGINFIFDEDIRSQSVTVFLEKATFAQALELLLRMNNLGKKVLNTKTIIIYPKTREKEKQYKDQLVQIFYLSNIDAKKAVNLLRTMLQLRKIYVHEELNALVIRDEPDVIRLAQQIIEAADRADSEVVFTLELVEVNHTDDLLFGPKLSNYSVSVGLANPGGKIVADSLTSGSTTTTSTGGTETGLASNLVSGLSDLRTFYTLPTATFDLKKQLSDSETLANPRIRVKNKEKAKVHIGSREPVITVTINGDQTSENIQYVDVGVKLDVEPAIQLDGTIITKINLEVSNATRLAALDSGTTPLVISTTNAQTTLTLSDGERTVIGGLIRDDKSKNKSTIAGLGSIPLLGSLFTSHGNNKSKREILLSITPHIVRSVDMPSAELATIWSGGEDDLKAGPNFGAFAKSFEAETEQPPVPLAPGVKGAEPLLPEALPVPTPAAMTAPEALPTGSPETTPIPFPEAPPESVPAPGPGLDSVPPLATGAEPSSVLPAGEAPKTVPPAGLSPEPPVPVPPVAPSAIAPGPLPEAASPAGASLSDPAAGEGVELVTLPPLEIPVVQQQARLFFQGPALVNAGEEFSLEARIDEVNSLYSAPLFVTYDPTRLDFVRAEEGTFLKTGGQATIFTTSADPARGQLIVGYKQGAGGPGATGGGSLFRLYFKGKSPGLGVVRFDRINFRDPAGSRLQVSGDEKTVEVR